MGWGLQCAEDMNDCKTVRRWDISLWGFSVEGVSGRSCLLCNFALMCSGVLLCRIVLLYQEPVEINVLGSFWCILHLWGKGGRSREFHRHYSHYDFEQRIFNPPSPVDCGICNNNNNHHNH